VKNIVVYIGIGLIRLVSWLPLPAAHALGHGIGKILYFTGIAKTARINISICFPELTAQQQDALVRDSLIALGKTYAEMGMSWMWPIPKVQKLITQVDGLEYLQRALDEKNGIILIAPHLGNWEVLNHFFRQHLFMTVMYKPAKIDALDKFIFKTRKRVDVGLVPAEASWRYCLIKNQV
jgi:Kdo2-lipid IVA lauroyltransferase/acyltransferase